MTLLGILCWYERRISSFYRGGIHLTKADCILVMETLIDTLSSMGDKKNATKKIKRIVFHREHFGTFLCSVPSKIYNIELKQL